MCNYESLKKVPYQENELLYDLLRERDKLTSSVPSGCPGQRRNSCRCDCRNARPWQCRSRPPRLLPPSHPTVLEENPDDLS